LLPEDLGERKLLIRLQAKAQGTAIHSPTYSETCIILTERIRKGAVPEFAGCHFDRRLKKSVKLRCSGHDGGDRIQCAGQKVMPIAAGMYEAAENPLRI
jgi:hypothetical protein